MSSLAKQLTFRIMAVVLVMMAVITYCVYFTVRAYMLTEAQERYEGALLRDHEEFRRRLSDVMVATKNNVHAHNIQMAMLPKMPLKSLDGTSEPDASPIDLFASLTPAREVGGDLYDFLLRDNRLFFCIGDMSGKGIPAALVMAVTRSLFHSIATAEENPERIAWRINRAICEGNEACMFVTMFVGVLDLTTGRLDYCNAGHEPPLLTGEPLPVKRNLSVGALSEWDFESQQVQLQTGDMLFLFTDGLSEAKNHDNQLLGRRHVIQIAKQHTGFTARQLVELMEEEVHRHAADAEQSDDITLLAIKWDSSHLSTVNCQLSTLTSPCEPRWTTWAFCSR